MSHSVSSSPNGKSSSSNMNFDEMSRIIAAARVARADYIAAQIRSLGGSWKISSSLNDFMRTSQLIAAARARRSAFFSRFLPAWLRSDRYHNGGAGRPKFS